MLHDNLAEMLKQWDAARGEEERHTGHGNGVSAGGGAGSNGTVVVKAESKR